MARLRNERAANLPSQLGAHGNVLQIRLRRAQAARGRAHLIKVGVHAALFVAKLNQRIDVGGAQLGILAVLQNLRTHRVLFCQLLQHLRAGGVARAGLLGCGQAHALEQHLSQLLGRIEVDSLPRQLGDLVDQAGDGSVEGHAQRSQCVRVHQEALPLHVPQHEGQRHLDVPEHAVQIARAHLLRLLNGKAVNRLRRTGCKAGNALVLAQRIRRKGAPLGTEHVGRQHHVEGRLLQSLRRQRKRLHVPHIHPHRALQQRHRRLHGLRVGYARRQQVAAQRQRQVHLRCGQTQLRAQMQRRPVKRLRTLALRAQFGQALQALHPGPRCILHRFRLRRVGAELRGHLGQLLRGHVHAQLLQPGDAAW